ncbi:MAG: GNAT family N-acetyltransferase [Candidatus Marinimicrobia bacterium]|nr:GNAT family N-acetyltransferase [Candidatus Neomarinimicrobiota bacterium]MCF7829277.1 GNAT family N-acetyltransferase [Candidatus Neomarinimicrobiota bacterium]MCF7881070.1 GNAT family N-acetyltransferase [Candidatus Neomarinimicrobiota bacterium]
MKIQKMAPEDWPDVERIYLQGIKTGNATFEQESSGWEEWDKTHREDCRLVAKIDGDIVGWAALSDISDRCVYAGVSEVSIYVDPNYQGKGIGSRLMEKLITESESAGIWTLQAGIFPENRASIRLHKKHGFREFGTREKLGKLDGEWRDVVLLERRSLVVGTD